MRMIKDYRAITNGKYRLVCNVLIPIILGVILALIDIGVRKYYVTAVMLGVGAALMTAIEVMADYWGFGAICVKGCLGMDYETTCQQCDICGSDGQGVRDTGSRSCTWCSYDLGCTE